MRKLIEWGVFVTVCLGVLLVAGPTSLGGSTSYVIVDGTSMEPTYHAGDLVVTRRHDTYDVGDVITYDAPVGRTYRVIHRVTDVTDGGYLTQGDNRDELDGWVVPFDAVHGASALVVPHGGTAAAWLRHPPALVALVAGWSTLTLLTRRETRRQRVTGDVATSDAPDDHEPAPGGRVGRSMNAALMTSMAIIGLAGGLLVANAAGLVVTGSIFQVFERADRPPVPDPDPSPPTELTVTVEWRLFNNGGQERPHRPVADRVLTLTSGTPYVVEANEGRYQNQPYAEVPCDTVAVDEPTGDWFGSGSFDAIATGTHIVCLQQQTGGS